jgi:cytoskeletal protein CcmA (bactofilin family)
MDDDDAFDDAEPMPGVSELEPAEGGYRATPPRPVSIPTTPRTSESALGVIASDSFWSGTLRSQGPLQIFGRVDGELTSDDEVFVAQGAIVNATLTARIVVVAGTIDGAVTCLGRLEVLPTGIVRGDVISPSLVVHEGATLEGELRMQPSPAANGS